MYQVTKEQIETVLHTVYQTNIPAQTFDALRKLLTELPEISTDKEKVLK